MLHFRFNDHILLGFADGSCLWRGDGSMAAPAVLHSLLWLQLVLRSPRSFQVVLNSLLTTYWRACNENHYTQAEVRRRVQIRPGRAVRLGKAECTQRPP